jgi:iron(III) transport system substrate-binding protein
MSVRRGGVATLTALVASASLACAGDGRTVLTVYSPHGKDLLEYYEKGFEAAHPDIDVQWVDMGAQEVLERVRAEQTNPQADVWFGATSEAFARAAREGLLQAYRPTWADAVMPDAHDAADLWYGTYLTPEVIGYNTDAVAAADAPRDWDDVLDAKWKGKLIIRDPVASGTMRAIFGAIIAREMARAGGTSPEPGYEWLRRLDAQTREYTPNPTIMYTKLGRQEGVITLFDMPDLAILREQRGFHVAYVLPASGTPIIVDGIAVVHGAKHVGAAQQFYEFVTTIDALTVAAEKFYRIPLRADVPAADLPAWIRDSKAQLKPMAIDASLVAEHLDEWMTYWDANIRNSGKRK